MRVLLKEGAVNATPATILILPIGGGGLFETLSGERVSQGVVAEANPKVVVASAASAAKERDNPFLTSKDLLMDLTWLDKELADYELGSRVATTFSGGTYVLDVSPATQVEFAEWPAVGDAIAIAPPIALRGLINARGHVVSVDNKWVEVTVAPGDRDRIERGTGLQLGKSVTIHRSCAEKLDLDGR